MKKIKPRSINIQAPNFSYGELKSELRIANCELEVTSGGYGIEFYNGWRRIESDLRLLKEVGDLSCGMQPDSL